MPDFLLFAAVYAVSGVVHGLVGFAFAVISVPLISMAYSPAIAVGMTIIVGPCLMLYNTWLHRHHLDFKKIVPLLLAGMALIPVGALFLHTTPESVIMITLGSVVILLTLFTVLSGERSVAALGAPGVGYGFSLLAGFIAGAFTTGGPPIVAYLYNTDSDRMRAKANTQLFFLIFAVAALLTHIVVGTVTAERTLRALPFIPIAFLSVRLGALLSARMQVRTFRYVTDAALVGLGIYLIVTNV